MPGKKIALVAGRPFAPADLGGLPARVLSAGGERASLLSNEPAAVLRELFRRGVDVVDLEVTGADLEEAFLALTRRGGGRGVSVAAPPSTARLDVAPLGRMLLAQTRSELRIRWRIPAFSVTIVALPVLFFTFFGLPYAKQTLPNGISLGAYLVASFAAYSVGSVMVFGFGIGVAIERGLKVDVLMRAMPLPPLIAILAKVLNALFYALLSLVVLIVYAVVVGGIRQDLTVWLDMIARLLAGSVPFIALGFAIGYLCGPNVAPAVANLVYLPLTFASGLFMPLTQLPGFVRVIAPYSPPTTTASSAGARSAPTPSACRSASRGSPATPPVPRHRDPRLPHRRIPQVRLGLGSGLELRHFHAGRESGPAWKCRNSRPDPYKAAFLARRVLISSAE